MKRIGACGAERVWCADTPTRSRILRFVEPRLIPINAWLALLTGNGGWPQPLRDAGFQIHRLEAPVATTLSTVVVDGLAINEVERVVQACEGKSGANVETDQARKYQALSAPEIARQVTLPPALSNEAPRTSVEVLYGCIEGNEARIERGLNEVGGRFATLVVGDGRVRLRAPTDMVTPSFDIEVPHGPPPRLIPVDAESPAEAFRELLLPAVVAAAARKEEVVSVDALLDRSIPYWSTFTPRQKTATRGKAEQVLRGLSETEYEGDFRVEPGGPGITGRVVRILRSPADYDARGETQGWQRLRRQGERALRGAGRRRREVPGQISFEDLVREIEREQN